jgi:hypothetical protein
MRLIEHLYDSISEKSWQAVSNSEWTSRKVGFALWFHAAPGRKHQNHLLTNAAYATKSLFELLWLACADE